MANPEGRPLKFQSVQELDDAIELYFQTDAFINDGEDRSFRPTMSGLALFLECDRKTLLNYSHKGEFFLSLKKAKSRVEQALEQRLYSNSVAGVIFNLKNNFGWIDKQEVVQETTHKGELTLAERLTGGSKR